MSLTISQTEPMIQAAKAKALELGANVSIAVVD
ncbi:MAG: heme-binding protein, partial [Chloroflexi bacterium]|nr:heme-binding protein [Chloroflexota bacterium]